MVAKRKRLTGPRRIPMPVSEHGLRPLMKWAGSKHRLGPVLAGHVGRALAAARDAGRPFTSYLEPFAGSGASFLACRHLLDGCRVTLSDASPGAVAVLYAARSFPGVLDEALGQLPPEPTPAAYNTMRAEFNVMLAHLHGTGGRVVPMTRELNVVRLASLALWLNRAGYNGVYRVNRMGEYNVPRGTAKVVTVPDLEWIGAVSAALAPVHLAQTDVHDVEPSGRALIYCDPPYLAGFAGYTADGFGTADHQALEARCRAWSAAGHVVLLSNFASKAVRAIYTETRGWTEVDRPALKHTVNRDGANRTDGREALFMRGTP